MPKLLSKPYILTNTPITVQPPPPRFSTTLGWCIDQIVTDKLSNMVSLFDSWNRMRVFLQLGVKLITLFSHLGNPSAMKSKLMPKYRILEKQ